ncbi:MULTISPECIES: S49 family peptidase [unclassified Mesorhizobium]|uniref:S49 family peptidase n=3 Tax=Mesorhizobium TaxID=68287 RepID=UPI000F763397|nr:MULTISPECIES: S49 family peptidase [unclassified Mesorhizobium]RVC69168.1 S49 family peptidase [Mesorhizobium sp. M00.F.Ca.ET.038.03.1.1]RVC71803.1 S49 family peptidase [Mesorhizobium sp. M2A.F.Ca.ET.046.02.1.1]AZO38765.1 S49 family peptidase [Mesorhizobium sp. M2A.F.Ca.ET.046.03.2.1]RWB43602.1 MAG: S49 family peptidase [Mesorhizobium sp.]RWX63460.1 S49 family peptidase [Mesorhizobium sp. M2A.F.Ca.ET.039.01.1.1]
MTSLIHIADRVLNRPLLITRDKAEVILSVLAGRIGINAPGASRFEGSSVVEDEDGARRAVPYRVTSEGVGIITITGSLVNRGAWVGSSSGLTSYEGIAYQLKSAAADPAVRSVVLDMHSPGGEAVGAFETAALVRDLAASKRTVAVVNGMAASAMYAIGAGATEIVTTETGISGSIGVVLLHADFSRQLDREGITPTLIHAGAHKVDGNPFEPLSDAVREDLQAEVDAFYESFLATVARGRGNRLTAAAARKTEARTFIGQAAVDAGIADRVGSFESVLADLTRAPGRSTSQARRTSMSEKSGAPAAEDDAGIAKADHDAAVKAARAEGRAEGEAAGAKTVTDRLVSALSAEGVKGDAARMSAALDLARKSPGMSGEDVAAFVSANVAVSKPAGEADASAYEKSRLAAAGLAQPAAKGAEASQQAASRILANYRASTGSSAKQA